MFTNNLWREQSRCNCEYGAVLMRDRGKGNANLTDLRWAHRGRPCPDTASLVVARGRENACDISSSRLVS